MTKLILNKDKILEYQQNRSPYLFIDYAEVEPKNFANGYKKLNSDEWFFKVHWPNDPICQVLYKWNHGPNGSTYVIDSS